MPAPTPLPGVIGGPPANARRIPVTHHKRPQTGAVSGFVMRPIVGVNIAFKSPALTDQPLWIRIDDPGSI